MRRMRARRAAGARSSKGCIDRGLTLAKVITFVFCMGVGTVPALLFGQPQLLGFAGGFLVLFATMTLGLVLYFTLGCLILRTLVADYLERLRLGERGHAGETAIMAAVCNVGVHAATLFTIDISISNILLMGASTLFFTYPVYYLVTTLWSLQPEVRAVLKGTLRLNTTHFANVPRRVRSRGEYLPITICLPIYTESNEVIFETIHGCKRALAEYQQTTGQTANLVVSDDGLAKLLGESLTSSLLETCLSKTGDTESSLPVSKNSARAALTQATERLSFYRREGITFVARPEKGRRGKFKKGGNLNYTYALARSLETGGSLQTLCASDGPFAGGYAEGDLHINELICLLDKDSGIAPGVLAATSPEFAADPSLAFTQHTTRATNASDNYFAWLQARFTDMVYQVSLTSKALQGLQVHLMGHSAFLRRGFLEATGNWAEDRVSEDYAKALDAYSTGWHAKHIAFAGLEFTEQVCTNFVEETDKQLRYCYGVSEVVLGARHKLPAAMCADMLLYYLSYFNLAAALPVIVVLLATHQIYYLFAGMLINAALFLLLPVVQGWAVRSSAGFGNGLSVVRYFALNALAFLGHTFSMLRGFVAYFADRIRVSYEPFGATNVDKKEHSFAVGRALIGSYLERNIPLVAMWLFIVVGCVLVLQDVPPHPVRPLVVLFLLTHVVAPFVLTPQLFTLPKARALQAKAPSKSFLMMRE